MNISIIGGGNLGASIASGIHEADPATSIRISRRNADRIAYLRDAGIYVTGDNRDCVEGADIVILAVKPHQVEDVLIGLSPLLNGKIVVSVVSGKEVNWLQSQSGPDAKIFRAMPNTAISRRESMTCISSGTTDESARLSVDGLFRQLGETVFIEEKLMDAATVLAACGIAYALRYIRAAMQAGIQIGFDSETALRIVSQTVKGASTLLLENQTHPEREIDKVTTPQGCTIVGLNEMEHQGFSSSLIMGIQSSFKAIEEMKKR